MEKYTENFVSNRFSVRGKAALPTAKVPPYCLIDLCNRPEVFPLFTQRAARKVPARTACRIHDANGAIFQETDVREQNAP